MTLKSSSTHIEMYLKATKAVLASLDLQELSDVVNAVHQVKRRGGRLMALGNGGGAAHAAHAVNDARKVLGIEAYCPADNAAELTARTNDDGWDCAYADWLRASRLTSDDLLFVFSVGGGDLDRNVSGNLVRALQYAVSTNTPIVGIVGRDGGYLRTVAEASVLIRTPASASPTPHTEGFQSVLWHLVVADPQLQSSTMRWEALQQ